VCSPNDAGRVRDEMLVNCSLQGRTEQLVGPGDRGFLAAGEGIAPPISDICVGDVGQAFLGECLQVHPKQCPIVVFGGGFEVTSSRGLGIDVVVAIVTK
jgi:hypothetical protein